MTSQSTSRPLYGGAMKVDLPSNIIDASDLRQVPDHQEVFLRPDTLSSIIFEINEYLTPAAVEPSTTTTIENSINVNGNDDNNTTNQSTAAATFHFKDVIPPNDHISTPGLITTSIPLPKPSVSRFPAYHTTGAITSPEVDRSTRSALPLDWQSDPAIKHTETKAQQILIRMKEYGTDLCIRVNIPMKEFGEGGQQSEAALTEVAIMDQIVERILQSFEIVDFGLFGGE